jgi:hypothetical protein
MHLIAEQRVPRKVNRFFADLGADWVFALENVL